MPKRQLELFILDILLGIDGIRQFSQNLHTVQEFESNYMAYNAIIREFEIIGEAMKYVLDAKEAKGFVKPVWRKIVNFRNCVAHEYFGVSTSDVFEIMQAKLPVLERELIELIKNLQNQEQVLSEMLYVKKDLIRINRKESLAYLERLEKILVDQKKGLPN